MYLTPPGAAGFAAHMDWMDVVVVQVSGRKLWRVARESTIYLTTWDKSTMFGDITDETGVRSYQEFIMEPGDVLYVPRGVVHNATNAPLAGEDEEPSLHLTFGMEHEGFTTFEGVMQHGVELFREKTSNIYNGVEITFGDDCVQTSEDGTEDWIILLNMAIYGLARMECDACLAMRQSVPRHEGWKQVYTQRVRAKANIGADETFSFEQALSVDLTSMANHLVSDTTLNGTLVLIEALVEELSGYGEDIFSYATRTSREEDVEVEDLECFLGAEIDEKVFLDLVARYATFLVENQQAIMQRFVAEEIKASAEFSADDDDILANKWGHTRFCDKEFPFAFRFANQSFDCEEE